MLGKPYEKRIWTVGLFHVVLAKTSKKLLLSVNSMQFYALVVPLLYTPDFPAESAGSSHTLPEYSNERDLLH